MNELKDIRNISFVGSGNVAWHLAKALQKAGIQIKEVYSPNKIHASEFGQQYKCTPVAGLFNLDPDVDFILLCVPDHQVKKVANDLPPTESIIAHTSGIVSLSDIAENNHKTGVFYPLQTFSKKREVDFSNIPFCIEGCDHHINDLLSQLAYKLSDNVVSINSPERELLHLTAVMVNNFSNMLYGMAHEILTENNIDFNLLIPLIGETAMKVAEITPHEAQTGPARRKDQSTIQRHKELLNDFPHYQQLYQLITEHIIKKHHE